MCKVQLCDFLFFKPEQLKKEKITRCQSWERYTSVRFLMPSVILLGKFVFTSCQDRKCWKYLSNGNTDKRRIAYVPFCPTGISMAGLRTRGEWNCSNRQRQKHDNFNSFPHYVTHKQMLSGGWFEGKKVYHQAGVRLWKKSCILWTIYVLICAPRSLRI